ncbi:MAG: glycosyltransferase [Spiribacter salinus]|uniref:Glycosyltransferase n=1 Tax=Spiribacter salinus TaxID=1335746 RepID=A0A540VS85_9GAMM|nr:MAG: glycosyltransferase [Spiribacter salinus]
MEDPRFTVVFATYNGERTLPLMLESLKQLRCPAGGWELIAVDNRSTDRTREILSRYLTQLPLRILEESRPGKNAALNAARESISGSYIVYTDDDIVADPEWLIAYERFLDANPTVAVAAGQVRHHWLGKPPAWLETLAEEGLAWAGTPISWKADVIPMTAVKGPNYVVRRPLIETHEYNTAIGPDGTKSYVKGSETSFLLGLSVTGINAHFVPSARVAHIVRPEQIGLGPLVRRYYHIGRGRVRTGLQVYPEGVATLFGRPRFVFSSALGEALHAGRYLVSGDRAGAARHLLSMAEMLGAATEWSRLQSN